jgi:O-antigen/teichoic acid export membrane protein
LSLKKNIAANYVSQIYVTLIGIVMLPVYIKYMGAEAYGLVGFFSMLQAWFSLLDLGLTPTIGRATARFKAGALSALDFRRLFRALHILFLCIALFGFVGLYKLAPLLVEHWLKLDALSTEQASFAIQIMAACISIRWVCGLYRGVVIGGEQLVWLSGYASLIATLRFVLVLPVMGFYGYTPTVFFFYQLAVALVEIIGLHLKTNHVLPSVHNASMGWSLRPIRSVLGFSLTVAFTASIWVTVTQTDKLILSSILPLSQYGYFTLAVLIAGGVMVITGPISSAIMPRMARLQAEGKEAEVIVIYRSSTQFVSIIAGTASITLAVCARPLLWAWTGDAAVVDNVAPTMELYAIGNGFLAVSAFPYYLQYARGNLRLHFLGSLILLCVMVPAIYFASSRYGSIGAGYSWMLVNLAFLLFWVGFVHSRLQPGLHLKWFMGDIVSIVFPAAMVGLLIGWLDVQSGNQMLSVLAVSVSGGIIMLTSIAFSGAARKLIANKVLGRRGM